MKVLLNDGLEKEGIELFAEFGIETDTRKRDLNSLIAEIGKFDALVVRSATKVTREVLESGAKGNLKIVGRAGVGYDNIDLVGCIRKWHYCEVCAFGKHKRGCRIDIMPAFECFQKYSSSASITEKWHLEEREA